MNWTELLKGAVEYNYAVAGRLMSMVDDADLDWKPSAGKNWMNLGQLLKHISDACGSGFKGFVTGDWGFPADMDPSSMSPEDMLPPAEKLPAVGSVAEAKQLMAADKAVAIKSLADVGEAELDGKSITAPWDPHPPPLGLWLLRSVQHLTQHKGQLFYYLKLMGKPVDTNDLWGA